MRGSTVFKTSPVDDISVTNGRCHMSYIYVNLLSLSTTLSPTKRFFRYHMWGIYVNLPSLSIIDSTLSFSSGITCGDPFVIGLGLVIIFKPPQFQSYRSSTQPYRYLPSIGYTSPTVQCRKLCAGHMNMPRTMASISQSCLRTWI